MILLPVVHMNPNLELLKAFEVQMEMWKEENRLASYKQWVFNNKQKCSAAAMAESGFYFIGSKEEPDAVQCFMCSKTLDGWEPNDDPWEEHVKHAPYCSFAQLRQPEAALSVNQLIELRKNQYECLLKKMMEESVKGNSEGVKKFLW